MHGAILMGYEHESEKNECAHPGIRAGADDAHDAH